MCTAAKEGYHCTIAFVIQMNGIHRVFPNEATVGKEDLEEMGTAMTLDLLEDGTGTMDYDGTVYDLTCDDSSITMEDVADFYTLEDGVLTLANADTEMVFERPGNVAANSLQHSSIDRGQLDSRSAGVCSGTGAL